MLSSVATSLTLECYMIVKPDWYAYRYCCSNGLSGKDGHRKRHRNGQRGRFSSRRNLFVFFCQHQLLQQLAFMVQERPTNSKGVQTKPSLEKASLIREQKRYPSVFLFLLILFNASRVYLLSLVRLFFVFLFCFCFPPLLPGLQYKTILTSLRSLHRI